MDFDPQPFAARSLIDWVVVCLALYVATVSLSLVSQLGSRGIAGVYSVWTELCAGFVDLFHLSFNRIYAVALLTFRESVRRKALAVFVVFAVLYMFGGWFLGGVVQTAEGEAKLFVTFALRTTSWLILPVVLLLSAWGIPDDIKQRSIHTVVTKPARRLEIVIGRILGFSAIGTLVVFIMGGVGWFWINRMTSDRAARAELTCRRPVFGTLSFLSRTGEASDKGINVGDIWQFKSFIEGATKAEAIYKFADVSAASLYALPDIDHPEKTIPAIRLESRFEAFRSHKGDMKRPIYFQFVLVNPQKQVDGKPLRVPLTYVKTFQEFRHNVVYITQNPVRLINETDPDSWKTPADPAFKDLDLLKDLVDEKGNLEIHVRCVDPGQYLGMARPDLFIRQPDQLFAIGYAKAVLGVELMMLLIVVLAVTASTFVKGPVATLLTFVVLVLGAMGREFMEKLLANEVEGGGPLIQTYRIFAHIGGTVETPDGPAFTLMKGIDQVLLGFMWVCKYAIPDFGLFNLSGYVANGFDVPFDAGLLPALMTTLGFLFPCIVIGYYSLRLRELEAK